VPQCLWNKNVLSESTLSNVYVMLLLAESCSTIPTKLAQYN